MVTGWAKRARLFESGRGKLCGDFRSVYTPRMLVGREFPNFPKNGYGWVFGIWVLGFFTSLMRLGRGDGYRCHCWTIAHSPGELSFGVVLEFEGLPLTALIAVFLRRWLSLPPPCPESHQIFRKSSLILHDLPLMFLHGNY